MAYSPQDKNLSLPELHDLLDTNAKLLLNNGVISRGLLMVIYCPLCQKPGAEISLRTGSWWHRCSGPTTEPIYGKLFSDPSAIRLAMLDMAEAAKEGREKMLARIVEFRKARKARQKARKIEKKRQEDSDYGLAGWLPG